MNIPPPQPPSQPPRGGGARASEQLVNRYNVSELVSLEMCESVLDINEKNRVRIQEHGNIFLPDDLGDPDMKKIQWESRWVTFKGVPNKNHLKGTDRFTVNRIFVRLLYAEAKLQRQVMYQDRGGSHKRPAGPADGPETSEPRNKRPNLAGGNPPAPDLTVLATRIGSNWGGKQDEQALVPSALRNPDGSQLDSTRPEFQLTPGVKVQDLETDFGNVQKILNSLNALMPQTNQSQHPLYMFQAKMNFALERMKAKCKSIAARNDQMQMVSNPMAAPGENLAPKLDKLESSVLEAVQGLHALITEKKEGGSETGELLKEIEKQRGLVEMYKKGFVRQKFKADELESALGTQRQRAARYTNLERLNHLEASGFLVDNRHDPPEATLDACALIVMNKPRNYWSEFDQDRWGDVTHEQRKDMMYGWDPTDTRQALPAWASYDKECVICGIPIGAEGGYSPGTCVLCIYHPGCLQELLLSGTRLECATCGVRFNLRLWQAFKCVAQYTKLMPEIGADGKELPKRTADMTEQEFQAWFLKDEVMIHCHQEILRRLIPKRHEFNDAQFRFIVNDRVPAYVDKKAESWGLNRPDWINDLKLNIRAICLPEPDGMPLFPEMVMESGFLHHPQYPRSFWRPANAGPPPGPAAANDPGAALPFLNAPQLGPVLGPADSDSSSD